MIAVAVSVLAGIYLLVPSILFDKVVSFFVSGKQFARSRTDEILYGLLVAIGPILIVNLLSRYFFWFGHWPFRLPPKDYSLKWADYHTVVLALSSDSFFKQNAKEVWDSLYRVWHHQLRFIFWMYAALAAQTTIWTLLLTNYARLQPYWLYKLVSNFIVGRVSEWHILLTTFLFHPSEKRTVYVDIVTPDGLYQGKIRNYFTDKDGALAGILLDETQRYRIRELLDARKEWQQNGSEGQKPDTRNYWTKIKGGTHLYIPAGQIGNLNIRYEVPSKSLKEGILRSFKEEEVLKALIDRLSAKSSSLTVTLGRPSPSTEPEQTSKPPDSASAPAPEADS